MEEATKSIDDRFEGRSKFRNNHEQKKVAFLKRVEKRRTKKKFAKNWGK